MPHMVISYARQLEDQIDIKALVQAVWNASEQTALFSAAAIKVRAFPVDHYLTANTDAAFVHIDAKLFVGRTDEQKQDMLTALFDAVDGMVANDIKISVEAIDMDKSNYRMR